MLSSEYRKGYVYIQNIYAGILEETDEGYIFAYIDYTIKNNY